MYPAHGDSANVTAFSLPIKWHLNLEYKTKLCIDFSNISNFLKLGNSTILNLKKAFMVDDNSHYKNHLKEKIVTMIKTGNYKTIFEIGKTLGINDSYVSRF